METHGDMETTQFYMNISKNNAQQSHQKNNHRGKMWGWDLTSCVSQTAAFDEEMVFRE